MKTKSVTIILAAAAGSVALICTSTAVAQRPGGGESSSKATQPTNQVPNAAQAAGPKSTSGAEIATAITPQEAAKKYPLKSGKYPMGERDPHKPSGIINSPYPPHTEYDCLNIPKGGLVLDTRAKQVFVRP